MAKTFQLIRYDDGAGPALWVMVPALGVDAAGARDEFRKLVREAITDTYAREGGAMVPPEKFALRVVGRGTMLPAPYRDGRSPPGYEEGDDIVEWELTAE